MTGTGCKLSLLAFGRTVAVAGALAAQLLAAPPAEAAGCDGMAGQEQMRIELLFGRSLPGDGRISSAAWREFLAQSVTPAFPDGLTVLDGHGQWRNAAGVIGHEPSTVVLIIAPRADDLLARLEAIRTAYKTKFHQESVGLVMAPVCASF